MLFICCQQFPPRTRLFVNRYRLSLFVLLPTEHHTFLLPLSLSLFRIFLLLPGLSTLWEMLLSLGGFFDHIFEVHQARKGERKLHSRKAIGKLVPNVYGYACVLNMFVCVTVSAVLLQVQGGCLSFFCACPASINRSLCAAIPQGLCTPLPLFFSPLLLFFLISHFSPPLPPVTLLGCLYIHQTAILGYSIIT